MINNLLQNNRKLLQILVITCIVCLIILIFIKITLRTTNTPMTQTFSPTISTSSPVTQNFVTSTTYTDPQNYFYINIPKNWHTLQESGTNIYLDNTNRKSITQQIEITKLYVSTTEGITIQIYTGVPPCPLNQPLTSLFAGLPASYNAFTDTWTIPTNKGLVDVSIFYPGSELNYQEFTQHSTSPLSSSEVETEKNVIKRVINTLVLTNLTTYSCK